MRIFSSAEFRRHIRTLLEQHDRHRELGWLATVHGTLEVRRPYRVFHDDGLWVHQFGSYSVISPQLFIPSKIQTEQIGQMSRDSSDVITAEYVEQHTILKFGDTVVEIGAGTGSTALGLSKLVGPAAMVVAVEAHPRTFACLEKTRAYNGLDNVVVENCAVLDRNGEILIQDGDNHEANSVFTETGIRVRGKTIDQLVAEHEIKRIALVIMNIEGAEKLAIRGMGSSIARTSHVAIGCHDFRAEAEGNEEMRTKGLVVEFLKEHGLEVFTKESIGHSAVDD